MDDPRNLPNGALLLSVIGLSRERLHAQSKAAVALPVLREIIAVAISKLPFDEEFYISTYEDVREAYGRGDIADLRTHFVEQGYFECRLGVKPDVDEEFYKDTYPDVAVAIASNVIGSALEHYLTAGVFEGRFANPEDKQLVTSWQRLGERR
jgi:hypothetical protein